MKWPGVFFVVILAFLTFFIFSLKYLEAADFLYVTLSLSTDNFAPESEIEVDVLISS